MPKKTDQPLSQEEQSARFLEAAHAIDHDGGLSHTEASARFEALVNKLGHSVLASKTPHTVVSGPPKGKRRD